MLRNNHLDFMCKSNHFNEEAPQTKSFQIKFNLEFLRGCDFKCKGCFVNRRMTYDELDLDIINKAASDFKDNGYDFDEIILGPTDIFAATNSEEILMEPKFQSLFNDNVVLVLLTTLQSTDGRIKQIIETVNKLTTCKEIEFLIAADIDKLSTFDKDYTELLKHKIQLLNGFNADVEYALIINIEDFNDSKFDIAKTSNYVRENFNTVLEFNPSFARAKNGRINKAILDSWNKKLLEDVTNATREKILFTMANMTDSGWTEKTYNYSNGYFYTCPFIYENVFDKSEHFKIPKSDGNFYRLEDFTTSNLNVDIDQFKYAEITTECNDCKYLTSCTSKQILHYMKKYDMGDCIMPKEVFNLYYGTNS